MYGEFFPMAGMQYTNLEGFIPNQKYPGHTKDFYDGIVKDTKNHALQFGTDDLMNGKGNIGYSEDILNEIFNVPEVKRISVGRVWALPLHAAFNDIYHTENLVGHDAGTSDAHSGYQFGPHNLAKNRSQVYHNIEIELLASHCDIF